jgi:ribosomal protein S18 acetylase RimI-like enzyme
MSSPKVGVIGFSQSVEWADSAVFVLALLLHIQTMEIFQKPQSLGRTLIRHLVEDLRQGTYKSLAETLGLEVAWDNS